MDNIARLSANERKDLFSETAARKGIKPSIAEKDFWVCWVLKQIFQDEFLSKQLMFKGGTSLSKAFGLISRFSEDIDLILDWRVVTEGKNPLGGWTKTKQRQLNDEINDNAAKYIANNLLARLTQLMQPVCECHLDSDDGLVVNVHYPASFSDEYLRPEVRLEIGPLASWLPYDRYSIKPYSAEAFPNLFVESECIVNAILAERTFWEKATILHHEAHRPDGNVQPPRYSRHYYDLAMMAKTDVKNKALADLEMLKAVVDFKKRFYARGWAHYDLAKPGTFKLIPEGQVLTILKKDYADMKQMIFGSYPAFDEVMTVLSDLESEINGMNSL
jgi:hypothetical protein